MKQFDAIVTKVEEVILAVSVLMMAFILIGGVISRSVFNASWTFTEEVGIALNVLVTFFAVGYCAREARHISMSIIYDAVSEKNKKKMMILISGVTFLVMAYLCFLSVGYTKGVYELGRVTPALRLPYWITIMPLPLGFFLAAFEYLRCFILNVSGEDTYISSKYKIGENTDEAMGVTESPENSESTEAN